MWAWLLISLGGLALVLALFGGAYYAFLWYRSSRVGPEENRYSTLILISCYFLQNTSSIMVQSGMTSSSLYLHVQFSSLVIVIMSHWLAACNYSKSYALCVTTATSRALEWEAPRRWPITPRGQQLQPAADPHSRRLRGATRTTVCECEVAVFGVWTYTALEQWIWREFRGSIPSNSFHHSIWFW